MAQYAFFQGEFVPIEQANVSIRNHTFNYGTGCFGGIRAYWNPEHQQLYAFRLEDHYRRFLNSCKMLLIDLPYSNQQLQEITVELLRREGLREDVYCRPLGYKADNLIGVRLHDLTGQFTIFCEPFGRYLNAEEGSRVMVSSWRRIDDNAIPARAKINGAYVNSAFAKSEAVMNGFDEAIVLTQDGHVSEGSAMNIFMVRNGVVITPPMSDNVLEGITSRSVMELLRNEMGMEVIERPIDRTELYIADELFFCGTGVQIASIIEVDHRAVGTGKMSETVRQLRDLYFNMVRGNLPAYRERWLTPVFQS
jgi:branched-chain amino acid aminotransferase